MMIHYYGLLLEDDYLGFIRIIFVDFYLHKYTKICSCIFLAFHMPIWAEQFYQYFKTFDLLLVAQYGPGSLVFLYAFMSMIIPMAYEKVIRIYIDLMKTEFLSLNTVSKELRQKILKQARYIVLAVKANLVLAVLTYFTYILKALRGTQWEVIYQVTFFKKYFPNSADVLIIIFYASLSYILIPMLLMVNMMVYCIIHGCFQSLILDERVTRIPENYPKRIELFYDEVYQKQVFGRLRFCINRGVNLKRILLETSRLIHNLVIVYTILGMCLIFCFIGSWHLVQDVFYPSIIMLISTSGFCCLMIVEAGQMVENSSIEIYDTTSALPWYTFNIRNQKMLLCILFYAAMPITVSPFRDFPVNRTLIVKFYKVGCSMYALTANMGQRIRT